MLLSGAGAGQDWTGSTTLAGRNGQIAGKSNFFKRILNSEVTQKSVTGNSLIHFSPTIFNTPGGQVVRWPGFVSCQPNILSNDKNNK